MLTLPLRANGPVTGVLTTVLPTATGSRAGWGTAVSNVVRHAKASTVAVELVVCDEVTIDVSDDGIGIAPQVIPRSGPADLAAMAAAAGGASAAIAQPEGGTLLRWSAPLGRRDRSPWRSGPAALFRREARNAG